MLSVPARSLVDHVKLVEVDSIVGVGVGVADGDGVVVPVVVGAAVVVGVGVELETLTCCSLVHSLGM